MAISSNRIFTVTQKQATSLRSYPLRSTYAAMPVLSRRSFLAGAAALTTGTLLGGCASQNQSALRIRLLNGSMPPQMLNQFRTVLKQANNQAILDFASESQLQTLFSLLQTWKQQGLQPQPASSGLPSWIPLVGNRKPPVIADLVTVDNYWLEAAIQQGIIQPFDDRSPKEWAKLAQDPKWQALVTRNDQGQPDPKGKVWGMPYRWGTTAIAYRQDLFREKGLKPPTDWSDLWRSELRGSFSLPDQAREVIGLVLKKLGKSYNTTDLSSVPTLRDELDALHQQVKLYSSEAYLQPLLLGDTWLAVGWSNDLLPLLQRNPGIAVVVPKAGTALWADLWVRPAGSASVISALTQQWLDFCWRSDVASQLSLLSQATAPAVLTLDRATLPSDLRENPVLLPDTAVLAASEFLQPLPANTIEQYRTIWETLRSPQ